MSASNPVLTCQGLSPSSAVEGLVWYVCVHVCVCVCVCVYVCVCVREREREREIEGNSTGKLH